MERYPSRILGDLTPAREVSRVQVAQSRQSVPPVSGSRATSEYWNQRLQGAPERLELPTDRPRSSARGHETVSVALSLGSGLTNELQGVWRHLDRSLEVPLLAAWLIVLSRLTGQDDLVIGVQLPNRSRNGREEIAASLATPVRVGLNRDLTGTQFLGRVAEALSDATAHRDVGLERTLEAVRPSESADRNLSLQSMFVFENATSVLSLQSARSVTRSHASFPAAQPELVILLRNADDAVSGALHYAVDLFERDTVERWVGYFKTVLGALIREPTLNIGSLPLIGDSERKLLLEQSNGARTPAPRLRAHEAFEKQVERTPLAVALVAQNQSFTYVELNAKANQLAWWLKGRGVGPDQRVTLCIERSAQMVIAMLGILKAGGAYVPLDANYPADRLAYMLDHAGPGVLLTQERLRGRLPKTPAEVIALDSEWNVIAAESPRNLGSDVSGLRSDHLAYVIYTSGSTGTPKAAQVLHRGLENLLSWYVDDIGITADDAVLVATSQSFDLTQKNIFGPLCVGAKVILASDPFESSNILELIVAQRITHLNLAPSAFHALIDVDAGGQLSLLRRVVLGGEPIQPSKLLLLREPRPQFINSYGPTECSDVVAYHMLSEDPGIYEAKGVPLGRPIRNTRLYVLDADQQPVPIGVTGEICIGGVAVGRGYLNRADLTDERFIPDPFSVDPQSRLYRSGDLGRWRADGTIEYLGRNDHQVKIRGMRIELGEIEARLRGHRELTEVAVIAREDVPGEKRLVAYVIPRDGVTPKVEELRSLLLETLPGYMLPSAFVTLERMPLSPNGKLNLRALPAPEHEDFVSRAYEAPQGDMEQLLAGIWQELLRVERVGRRDNFFELGGHSLLVVHMMERLRRLVLSTDFRRVFESATLADLAAALIHQEAGEFEVPSNRIPLHCERIEPGMLPLIAIGSEQIARIVEAVPGGVRNVQDIYPLAALQEGILFHHLLDSKQGDTYILSSVLSVASRARLDDLICALQTVIDRHDVLRTAILWEGLPQPVQVVCRQASLPVEEITLDRNCDAIEQLKERMKPRYGALDLRRAPLMRLQVVADARGDRWFALLRLHHITCDNTSHEIVMAEVRAHLEGRARSLPERLPYRNHVAQAAALSSMRDAESFFRNKFGDVDEPTAVFGLLEGSGTGFSLEEARLSVGAVLVRKIRIQSRRAGVSAATMFHAAWSLVVAQTSARDDVVFGTVLLGQLQGSAAAQGAVGMFINTLPLRLRLANVTVRGLIEQTHREIVDLLSHEQASLSIAQRCSGVAGTPLFNALLNYRHRIPNPAAEWADGQGINRLAHFERTSYPVTVSVDDEGDGFTITAQTDSRIDPNRVITYLNNALESLVDALESAPRARALTLCSLPESERRQVTESFNETRIDYPREKLVQELFEEQVQRNGHAIAIVHESRRLSYAELNARANELARFLRTLGVGPDQVVGLCVDRSPEMVIGLLGILKAGGAYLPLDPNYPVERLQHMLDDASPRVVLTQETLLGVLPSTRANVVKLDTRLKEIASCEGLVRSADLALNPQHLLYLIYTSGSTGMPKGTAMSHTAMVNLIEWHRRIFGAQVGRRVLQFAALSFDVAFQEIFSTLCTGGTLTLLDEWVRRDSRALAQFLLDQRIERLFIPPMMLQCLAEYFRDKDVVPATLLDVITAGEQLRISPEIVHFFERLEGCRLHNHYGPTETHVVTALTFTEDPSQWPTLPSIGRPISNSQIYILDERGQPLPLGVAGEIYIGGVGVARGYFGQPELTAQRFISNPFRAHLRERLYKTGDLGRWRSDGNLECLGRNDGQVKIRGYRIEVADVEVQIAGHAKIKEVAVIAREDVHGCKRLVAYFTCREEGTPGIDELRAHLKVLLPDFMVPSAFVCLESLPLTPSGKLNRRALPEPDAEAYARRVYEAPQGQVEQLLAGVWQDLLKVGHVGRQDNFFDLGGHSLLAMQVLVRIRFALATEISMRTLFQFPTLKDLSAQVTELREARLRAKLTSGGNDVSEMLDTVASMSEGKVRELLQVLKVRGTP